MVGAPLPVRCDQMGARLHNFLPRHLTVQRVSGELRPNFQFTLTFPTLNCQIVPLGDTDAWIFSDLETTILDLRFGFRGQSSMTEYIPVSHFIPYMSNLGWFRFWCFGQNGAKYKNMNQESGKRTVQYQW